MMNYPNPFKLKEPLNNPMTAGMGMQLPPPIQQPKVMPPLEPDTPSERVERRNENNKRKEQILKRSKKEVQKNLNRKLLMIFFKTKHE